MAYGPRLAGQRAIVLRIALCLYVLVLGAGPFLHHDLACHLKSRTHCTACVLNASISAVDGGHGPQCFGLSETGPIVRSVAPTPASVHVLRASGRSPPA